MSVAESYLEAAVLSAKPYQLHLMVVQGAIRFAKQALHGLENQDYEVCHFSLNRSRDCVTELIGSMNADIAPEIVGNLRSLFAFAFRALSQADIQRNAEPIHAAIQILESHRETWMEVMQRFQTEQAQQMPQSGESRSWLG